MPYGCNTANRFLLKVVVDLLQGGMDSMSGTHWLVYSFLSLFTWGLWGFWGKVALRSISGEGLVLVSSLGWVATFPILFFGLSRSLASLPGKWRFALGDSGWDIGKFGNVILLLCSRSGRSLAGGGDYGGLPPGHGSGCFFPLRGAVFSAKDCWLSFRSDRNWHPFAVKDANLTPKGRRRCFR